MLPNTRIGSSGPASAASPGTEQSGSSSSGAKQPLTKVRKVAAPFLRIGSDAGNAVEVASGTVKSSSGHTVESSSEQSSGRGPKSKTREGTGGSIQTSSERRRRMRILEARADAAAAKVEATAAVLELEVARAEQEASEEGSRAESDMILIECDVCGGLVASSEGDRDELPICETCYYQRAADAAAGALEPVLENENLLNLDDDIVQNGAALIEEVEEDEQQEEKGQRMLTSRSTSRSWPRQELQSLSRLKKLRRRKATRRGL